MQVEVQLMRIAKFLGIFPGVFATFINRQIIDLLELGHEVDIYVEYRPRVDPRNVVEQPDVQAYHLLDRTIYMDAPPLHTGQRYLTALRRAMVCYRLAPRLTLSVFNPAQYGRSVVSLSALHRLYRLAIVSDRYDVLHAHAGMVANRFLFASALWQTPLVVSFHGQDFSVWPRKFGLGYYQRLFANATAVTANSEHTRRRLEALGCPSEKIHKAYESWDMKTFAAGLHPRRPGEPIRVLTVARLVEKKGIEYAIRAVALARRTHPQLCLDIVGDGHLRPQLEALIRQLNLGDAVTLHRALPSPDVARLMAQSHIFTLPSVTAASGDEEGQGVALVEAQATGLPVVATLHGPFPEVVRDGITGFLVPERDPVALADRMVYLADHPETAEAMGAAGRKHVEEQFDERELTRQVLAIYEWSVAHYHHLSPARTEAIRT
jgi:colanic acid/amylovoran/stewartan biosynthesis glycosyltransferase WcaL/AmsK/CpsK